MTLGDRVAVMRNGTLEQVDEPQDVYDRPANVFVASFIGSPAMNLFSGTLEDGALRTALGEVPMPAARRRALAARPSSRSLIVGIRPEDLHPDGSAEAGPSPWRLEVQVELVESLGSETLVHFPVGDAASRNGSVMAVARDSAAPTGHAVARLDARNQAVPGATLSLAVDPERLHFFVADPAGARVA
jgi:multiple sugar transport system ATP-binding protein